MAISSRNVNVRQGAQAQGLEWALTSGYEGDSVPLTSVSHMLNCQLFGLDSGSHRVHNVLLHALAAVMLCLFLGGGRRAHAGECVRALTICIASAACPGPSLTVSERKDVCDALLIVSHSVAVCSICGAPQHRPILSVDSGFCPRIDDQAR